MSTATRTAKLPHSTPSTAPPVAAPVRREREYHFDVPEEFPIFGRWREPPVAIAAEESIRPLAFWLAANDSSESGESSLWARCVEHNSVAFNTLRPMELFDSSLDLPRGTVVFQTVEAPPWIEDDPPGEILDRLNAVRTRYPEAKIWLHEPVFRQPVEGQAPCLLTREMLQEREQHAREAVWAVYRKQRRWLLVEFRARLLGHWMQTRWQDFFRRRAIRRQALRFKKSRASLDRKTAFQQVQQAMKLGMEAEADFMHLLAFGPHGMSPQALQRAEDFCEAPTLWDNVKRSLYLARPTQWDLDICLALAIAAIPVAMVVLQASWIPGLLVIDPILTYTLPADENRHWFIGHWDWRESPEGTKKLVYVC
jgi:hypothetical protein